MATNPYTSQLKSFSAATPNARRGLIDLYKERKKAVNTHYNYAAKNYGAAVNATDRSYGASLDAVTGFGKGGRQLLDQSGYGGRQGSGENARADPELSAMVRQAVEPFKAFLGSERDATKAWYRGYKGAEQAEDKTLKAGLIREQPAALSELEQGIIDTQSNLQAQGSAFEQQQAYNNSLQSYMAQSLAFQKQMAQGAQGGTGSGSAKGLSPNAAQWQAYAKSQWGVTVGGWRAHGSVPNSDHPKGLAIDIMSSGGLGNRIANEFVSNASQRGVSYVIYNHQIWSPGRGWHPYHGPNPHTDHVHVSFRY